MSFALGQRWISESESDLGLGAVVALDDRSITILFPASGEQRCYARQQAPLSRIRFLPGDRVRSAEGFELVISHVEEVTETLVYHGSRVDTHESIQLREILLDHFLSFSQPQDRMYAGQIDRLEAFSLRYQSQQQLHRLQQDPLRGLSGARISLIPHQLYIAEEVAKRHAPRVMLADEVGLGKTIEAGLILHQQLISGLAQRALILVPESLQHQWLVEMLRRFNLTVAIFDQERCEQSAIDQQNPFETAQIVLCSLEFLSNAPEWLAQAVAAPWDLLVVDEAHHLSWDADTPSLAYQCVAKLAAQIPGMILLTATPDQLGHRSHFARLQLLDGDRFYDYQAFLAQEAQFQQIAMLADQLLHQEPLSIDTAAALHQLLMDPTLSAPLQQLQQAGLTLREREQLQQIILQPLLDRHGTGRVLFRNSRRTIAGFPQRIPNFIGLDMPTAYQHSAGRLLHTASEPNELSALLTPERLYSQHSQAPAWHELDPRIDSLIQLLKQHKTEKFLLICAHAETAMELDKALMQREGIRAAVFHERMSIMERDKAAAYFAQQDYSAQILLCSEIGSEGRNFQFAHHLVLFDLPLNPDLLEQRIGRLDRIGQQQDIQLHILYFKQSAQDYQQQWYHQVLNAFAHTCQTGAAVFQQTAALFWSLLQTPGWQPEQLAQWLSQSAELQHQLQQQLEQGRDQLLELNSSGGAKANALSQQLAALDNQPDLALFMCQSWDQLGVQQEERSDTCLILKPSEQLEDSYCPGLHDDGVSITFDRSTALAQEDIQFLSWDHPMVLSTLDYLTEQQRGNNSVALLHNPALPAGSWFLELIYLVEASAPAKLQLGRYLPVTPIRLLMDPQGRDLAKAVSFAQLEKQLAPLARQGAAKVVKALRKQLDITLTQAEQLALQQLPAIQQQAQQSMQHALGGEAERLQQLRQVNPAVRQEEIAYLQQQQTDLSNYIAKARLKLDAIRLVVVSHDRP
ncbi:RNA polymerase-associated protein RapA [Alkalimonas amylolytica]|uniref:RNA polymerase-associated protein RapA n=1 Tax=Alkalimonas amylolytica TaxID=152573 RepID=A0A1H3XW68_ALKAM|nr:RNA polymerase-associated protein RapA [Alkalimonas amylolytica]SEA03715.1 ATP-dependent helicase HepA [Alkalimonas amylolytica]